MVKKDLISKIFANQPILFHLLYCPQQNHLTISIEMKRIHRIRKTFIDLRSIVLLIALCYPNSNENFLFNHNNTIPNIIDFHFVSIFYS